MRALPHQFTVSQWLHRPQTLVGALSRTVVVRCRCVNSAVVTHLLVGGHAAAGGKHVVAGVVSSSTTASTSMSGAPSRTSRWMIPTHVTLQLFGANTEFGQVVQVHAAVLLEPLQGERPPCTLLTRSALVDRTEVAVRPSIVTTMPPPSRVPEKGDSSSGTTSASGSTHCWEMSRSTFRPSGRSEYHSGRHNDPVTPLPNPLPIFPIRFSCGDPAIDGRSPRSEIPSNHAQ